MARKTEEPGLDRRGFLKSFGGASTVAVAAAAAPVVAATGAAASESNAEKRKARYRVTPHVEAFYRTNRY
jgi:hypothetical protein